MAFLWWGKKQPPAPDTRPDEIKDYDSWTGGEDVRNAVALAKEIKDAQGNLVLLEGQHHDAVRELRRLMRVGGATALQRAVVDDLARRLRSAQAHVEEMRAYARFFYPGYFKR